MAHKLTMSLDQIIQSSGSSSNHKQRPKAVKASSHNSSRPNVSKFQRRTDSDRDRYRDGERDSEKDRDRERASVPMKVITKERPKIIRPGAEQEQQRVKQQQQQQKQQPNASVSMSISTAPAPASGSVFSRLGNSDTRVLFKNLQSSVKEEDVVELCRAVGEVKNLNFLRGFDGLGQARVQFAEKKSADECVQMYHGISLDGLDMLVTIEHESTANATMTRKITNMRKINVTQEEPAPAPVKLNDKNNVKAGIFGTALDNEDKKKKNAGARTVSVISGKRNSNR